MGYLGFEWHSVVFNDKSAGSVFIQVMAVHMCDVDLGRDQQNTGHLDVGCHNLLFSITAEEGH